ncbi:MAG: integration host factor subunit beta [Verrucomicrobia bacterium]|nr:integration host factor subunit beta [Verrucomicrobiota bacterium]
MATITKRELAIRITDKIAERTASIPQQVVSEIIQTFIDEVAESLASGHNVVMRRFGAFEVREMKAKLGRNPKNPTDTVKIPARAGVKFKPGKELKEKVAASLKVVREIKRKRKKK